MLSIDKISTSTNLLCFKRGGRREMVSSIPLIASYGYKNIDINFCEMLNPNHRVDNAYIGQLKSLKESLGLNYNQSHVPYIPDYLNADQNEKNRIDDLIKRAFEYSEKLNIDTVVIHPIKGSIEDNINYFERVLKDFPSSCRLAIENMERYDEIGRATELIQIIDSLNNYNVGICLDTGHAHMYGLDIPSEIKAMGKYLIGTHIADNHQKYDEHFMPFFGSINWEEVIKALNEIDYNGYLTYEIMFFFKYLPEDIQEDVGRLSYKILTKLISFSQTNNSF